MKKMYFAMLVFGSLAMSSCGGTDELKEKVSYKVDSEATTLSWTGSYVADGHTHVGTVSVASGEMNYKGDTFVSGNFVIDMKSIEDTDLESPKKDTLEAHLGGIYFFNTSQFSEAIVTINEISDKEIKATIKVMGKEIPAVMPLKITKNDKGLSAKGKFTVDFASTEIMGFSPAPGDPENMHVDSKIEFELNLVMNK